MDIIFTITLVVTNMVYVSWEYTVSLFFQSVLLMFFSLGMGTIIGLNSLEFRHFSDPGWSLCRSRALRSLDWMSGIIGLKDHLI